jgi:hypothetical protein
VRPVLRCYKQDKSSVYLVVRQSPASMGVNTEAEEARRWKPLPGDNRWKVHQTEKT